jgi:hypothetical protein
MRRPLVADFSAIARGATEEALAKADVKELMARILPLSEYDVQSELLLHNHTPHPNARLQLAVIIWLTSSVDSS